MQRSVALTWYGTCLWGQACLQSRPFFSGLAGVEEEKESEPGVVKQQQQDQDCLPLLCRHGQRSDKEDLDYMVASFFFSRL